MLPTQLFGITIAAKHSLQNEINAFLRLRRKKAWDGKKCGHCILLLGEVCQAKIDVYLNLIFAPEGHLNVIRQAPELR